MQNAVMCIEILQRNDPLTIRRHQNGRSLQRDQCRCRIGRIQGYANIRTFNRMTYGFAGLQACPLGLTPFGSLVRVPTTGIQIQVAAQCPHIANMAGCYGP